MADVHTECIDTSVASEQAAGWKLCDIHTECVHECVAAVLTA